MYVCVVSCLFASIHIDTSLFNVYTCKETKLEKQQQRLPSHTHLPHTNIDRLHHSVCVCVCVCVSTNIDRLHHILYHTYTIRACTGIRDEQEERVLLQV